MAGRDRTARVRITASEDSALGRVLKGVIDKASKATRQVASSEQAAAKQTAQVTRQSIEDAKRALLDKTNTAEALARRELQAEKDAAREGLRAKQRADREAARSAERAASQRIREEERAAQETIRNAKKLRRERRKLARVAIGGGLLGAAHAAGAAIGRGQGVAGVGSLDERLNTAGDFRHTLIRTANEAGVSEQRRKVVEEQLLQASEAFNVPLSDLVGGLETGQVRFDAFEKFVGIMGELAKVSQVTGDNLQDLTGAVGTQNQAFNLQTQGQQTAALDLLISTAQRGAVSPGDFAREMAPYMGTFAMQTGRTGIEGLREFYGLAQIISGQTQAGASRSATMLNRLAQELNDPKIQRKIKQRSGIDVLGEGGMLRPFEEIARDFAGSEMFQRASRKGQIFGREEGMMAATAIAAAYGSNPEIFQKFQGIEAGAGLASMDRGMQQLRDDPMFQLQAVGFKAQADTVRDLDRIVKEITPAIRKMTELQTEFPLLNESLGTLEGAVRGLTTAFVGYRLATAGAGAGGGAAAAAGAAGGGSALMNLAKSGGFKGVIGKLGVVGAAAGFGYSVYEMASSGLEAVGYEDWLQERPDELRAKRGLGGARDRGVMVDRATGQEQQQILLDPVTIQAIKQNMRGEVHLRVFDDRIAVQQIQGSDGLDMTADTGNRRAR